MSLSVAEAFILFARIDNNSCFCFLALTLVHIIIVQYLVTTLVHTFAGQYNLEDKKELWWPWRLWAIDFNWWIQYLCECEHVRISFIDSFPCNPSFCENGCKICENVIFLAWKYEVLKTLSHGYINVYIADFEVKKIYRAFMNCFIVLVLW